VKENEMSNPQEQYLQTMQQGQEVILSAVNAWTKTVQDTFSAVPGASSEQVDPSQVVDQVFDFAEKMLEMQRDFAKSLIGRSAALAEDAANRTSQAADKAQRA
jgi:acetyl-CoA carboxylase carboxyltransferase component